jgi:nucleoside-diphosphate-sugar epimerase
MHSRKKLLITGASGFLGRVIAAQAQQDGINVRCTGRSTRPCSILPDYHSVDLTDPDSVDFLFGSVTRVIHAAGLAHQFGNQSDMVAQFQHTNVEATRHVVTAAARAGVKQFVLVSSVSVYGSQITSPVPDDAPCHPVGPYAESKWQSEKVAMDIADQTGMGLTILRMATIYGEHDPGNVLNLVRAIDRGRFVWIGRGRNMKSLIHVDDAAQACLRAALTDPTRASEMTPRIFNVSATPESMHTIVQSISHSLGQPVRGWYVPATLPLVVTNIAGRVTSRGSIVRRLHGTIRKWVANDAYDGSRFAKEYDFSPSISLSDGIGREVAWYQKAA